MDPSLVLRGPDTPLLSLTRTYPDLLGLTRIPRTPKNSQFFRPFWRPPFFRILATKMPNLSPKGPQKLPKWNPKGSQKPNFFDVRAEMKIELPLTWELNFQGPGPPKTNPKRCQKPKQPSDSVPDLTFEPPSRPGGQIWSSFGRFGDPLGGGPQTHFKSHF